MIVKRKDGYHVLDHTGQKNLGGPYDSLEKAHKRLAEVEAFKHETSPAPAGAHDSKGK